MSIGIWEITLILVIVFVVFGAGKLPQVMSDLGKGVKGLKQGMKDEKDNQKSAQTESEKNTDKNS
jgi:sec-independent protein translocase protein TatA